MSSIRYYQLNWKQLPLLSAMSLSKNQLLYFAALSMQLGNNRCPALVLLAPVS